MLHLVIIAALCIFSASAQDCSMCEFCDNVICTVAINAITGCNYARDVCIYCDDSCNQCEWNPNDRGACSTTDGYNNAECCGYKTTTDTPTTTTTTANPTAAPTCPTDTSGSCDSYSWECCPEDTCTKSGPSRCSAEDFASDPLCTCEEQTETPTTSTTTDSPTTTTTSTATPTAAPTCPTDTSGDCDSYSYECCPDTCRTSGPSRCQYEDFWDDEECLCEDQTETPTTSTTTASPTTSTKTESPTTTTTTASPTTSTTTATPTTSTEEAETTEEGEEKTTEEGEEKTTEEGEEKTTEEGEEKTTEEGEYSWPTPRPTYPSAEKWEMIHPAYSGGDGELLWHVYYGDFSNDQRFDSFRKAEKWDTQEIRPIIMHDKQFKKYRHHKNADSQKFNQQSAVVTDTNTGASLYGKWLIALSAVLVILFAVWYKFGNNNKKSEYTPLLTEEKVQYDQ